MLVNPKIIENKLGFSKIIADWLQKENVPLLGIDGNVYYFMNTATLKESLKRMPIKLKIKSGLIKWLEKL